MNALYVISVLALIFSHAESTQTDEDAVDKLSPSKVIEHLEQYFLQNREELGIKFEMSTDRSCPAEYKESEVKGKTLLSAKTCLIITNLIVTGLTFDQVRLEIDEIQLNITIIYNNSQRPEVTLDMDSPFGDAVSVYVLGEKVVVTEIQGILLATLKDMTERKLEEVFMTYKLEANN